MFNSIVEVYSKLLAVGQTPISSAHSRTALCDYPGSEELSHQHNTSAYVLLMSKSDLDASA